MKIKQRHFPYPVLSPFSDDVGGRFEATIEVISKENEMEFTVQFNLENETLKQIVEVKQAAFGIHIECSSTMKRFYFSTFDNDFVFLMDPKYLNNIVEINFFVIADQKFEGYINTRFHEDFEGVKFNLQKGDQLAFAETIKLNIEKEPIAKTNSIFELAVNSLENAPLIATDFYEKIVISIPKEAYEELNNLRGFIGIDVDQLFISMYYTPALIEALYYIRDLSISEELHLVEDNVWYRSIANRLEKLGKSIESEDNIPNLAMLILDKVNERAFVSIARIFGIESEGEPIDE